MRKQQVIWDEERGKKTHTKRKSFLKKTICKTRSLKPDYRATMTQSLMFIPVIRCEEEDLYFIVVECIQAALRLSLCLVASLGNIFLLLRPGIIPPWRKPRCLQPTADQPYNGSSITSDTTRGKISSIQSKAFSALADLTEDCVWFGWLLVRFLPSYSSRLLVWGGLHWIVLIVPND